MNEVRFERDVGCNVADAAAGARRISLGCARGCARSSPSPHRYTRHAARAQVMEEHGTHCTLKSCNSISLLPIACPSCTEKYCEEHYLPTRHACANAPLNAAPAAGAIGKERLQCQVKGCLKPTLEMAASAIASSSQASGKAAVTHQAPRCARCKGLFCTRSVHSSPRQIERLMFHFLTFETKLTPAYTDIVHSRHTPAQLHLRRRRAAQR